MYGSRLCITKDLREKGDELISCTTLRGAQGDSDDTYRQ